MKFNIRSLVDSVLKDNESAIKESGCESAAEWLLLVAQSGENGYHFFLDDLEIFEFEAGGPRREELARSIEDWIESIYSDPF